MYWCPLYDRTRNRPQSSVYNVSRATSKKWTSLHSCFSNAAAYAILYSVCVLYVAAHAVMYAELTAASVVADWVDRIPCCTCVMCPITVASSFAGNYCAVFVLVRPGHKRKLPVLIAANQVCFTGDSAVACMKEVGAKLLMFNLLTNKL